MIVPEVAKDAFMVTGQEIKYKLLLIGQLSYTNSDTEHYMVQLGERYPIIKE